MKKNNTKYIISIIISLIIGISILGCGYFNYKYKKEALEQKIHSEELIKIEIAKENTALQQKLQNCLDDVNEKFGKADFKGASLEEIKIILDFNQKQKDECFKKYPQK